MNAGLLLERLEVPAMHEPPDPEGVKHPGRAIEALMIALRRVDHCCADRTPLVEVVRRRSGIFTPGKKAGRVIETEK